jgi:hypothetical protein
MGTGLVAMDMLYKKCVECKKGKYYEWSFYCDRGDEPLACTKCNHKIARYPDDEKEKEKEMTDPSKEDKPLTKHPPLSPEEREEMLAWCPTQEQAVVMTREKGIAAFCLKRIERIEAELAAIKKSLGEI